LGNSSDVLRKNYINIVDEFKEVPNNLESINNLYASIDLVKASDIINEFDHSKYFCA